MAVRVAINGFGRIGRLAFRQMFKDPEYEIVAINDLTSPKMLAYLLKYDSTHGKFPGTVEATETSIKVDGKEITIYKEKDAANLPWAALKVDVVLECTGFYTSKEKSMAHIKAGARKVVISAPAGKDLPTIVFNVNHKILKPTDQIISAASCTTNCLAPMAKVLHDNFGIVEGLMTTVHAATATQSIVDEYSKKNWRLGRSTYDNIIPSTTGAAKAVGKVIPELQGKLTGMSMRIPAPDGSIVDLTVSLAKETTYEEVCAAMKAACEGELKDVMAYEDQPIVSSDIIGETHSSIFDAQAGIALNGHFMKLCAWYDNEYGFTCNMMRLLAHIASVRGE